MTAPSQPHLSLRVGAGSDVGRVRDENQDRISRFRCSLGELFLVVDGMGGHRGGSQAAETTVAGLERHLTSVGHDTPVADALRDAAAAAHAEIRHRASAPGTEYPDMGATAVMVLVRDGRAWVAHAGDSRAYLMRGGRLSRLTSDHTVVQRMVDRNLISEEEARHHPDASVVSRAFGRSSDFELEVAPPLDLRVDDRLVLCSDGLCGYVDDETIAGALHGEGAQAVADRLLALALEAGGEDNVSVQVLSFRDPTSGAAAAPPAASGGSDGEPAVRGRRWPLLGMLALLLFAIVFGTLLGRFLVGPWLKQRWGDDAPRQERETGKRTGGAGNRTADRQTATPSPDAPQAAGRIERGGGGEELQPRWRLNTPWGRLEIFEQVPAANEKTGSRPRIDLERGYVYHPDGLQSYADRVAEILDLDSEMLALDTSAPEGGVMRGSRVLMVVLPDEAWEGDERWVGSRVFFHQGVEKAASLLADVLATESVLLRDGDPPPMSAATPVLIVAVDNDAEDREE